jgi:hypothetical protein
MSLPGQKLDGLKAPTKCPQCLRSPPGTSARAIRAIETAIAHVVCCNPWIAIDTTIPHVVESGRISDDELAAAEPMVRPVGIAGSCASGRGRTHHQQDHETLHDASPSVKIIMICCTVSKIIA